MKYNWQQNSWPEFNHDTSQIQDIIFNFAEKTGHVSGILKSLPEFTHTEAIIGLMVSEAVKTSEIEGEYLSRSDVMSSIRHQLGLDTGKMDIADKRAKGAAELMVDIRKTCLAPLSEKKLFEWHRMLLSGSRGIKAGNWRTHKEAMQIISGPAGKWKVHFEVTPWIVYFSNMALDAQLRAEKSIAFILAKKYIAITKTSKASATRDLLHLSEIGALIQTGGGRSTRYKINL